MGFINDNESELSESSDTITICRNCHLPGHKRKNCPRDGECERCYQRTHSIDKCPYNTPEFADVTFIPVPYNAPGTLARDYYPQPAPIERKSFEDIPSDLGELEAWQPYDGDDVEIIPFERPGFIPHIAAQVLEYPVKPSVLLNHDVVFPDLHDLLASLIGGLRDERWKHLTVMPYYGMIEMFGGKEEVIRCAFESIPPEITALQGKVVTVKQLDTIRAIQGAAESWPRETGYLDYVTDLRNGEYYRPYVGQSSDAAVRIHQHLTALEKDRRNTLHYYIVSEGRQYREMNYIRLWSLPLQVTSDLNAKESRLLLNNILEFIMCRAFQSLQPSELDPFFGKGNYMTTGLNILPPFLQGISLSVATRAKYISKCLGSADEQIRMWPSERKKQHDSSRIAPARHEKHRPYRYWCGSQYHDALARAIRDTENCEDLVWSGDDNLQCPHTVDFTELQQKAGIFAHYPYPQPPLVRPFGSPEARVGVILDTCPVNKAGNSHNIEQNITALPAALIEANFTELNSLVWTNDLRQCFQSGSNSSRQTVSYQDDNLKAFHRALIETSNLRVILLGGRKAERMIIREELLENKTVLHLLDCSLVAYLETNKEKTEVQRIYVRLTASLGITSHCASWEETKEHSEALKFAAEISETPSIHGFSIVSKLVGKEIILRHWLEREKKLELMTMSTMPSSIREWFALKGITSDQHIELFERLGGSLARGAFLLLCTLPKSGWTHERSILKREFSTTPNAVGFGKEVLQKSKELYSQLTGYDYAAASTTDVTVDNGPASNRRSVYPVPSFTSEELETLFEESRNHDTKTEELNAADTNSRDTSLFNPPEKPAYKLAAQEDEERESLLRGKFFSGHVYKKLGSHYQIWALKHMLTVRFSHDNVDLSEGFILQVLMSPPGTRHPHVYATQTLESDPAARIAVKITGVQTDGTEFCLYARQQVEAWKEPMRLNAVFDWFTGLSIEQIALRNSPRRYIYISNRDFIKSGSESLAGCVRGGFTEGSLSSQEAEWWEIEKAKNARLKRGKV